MTGRTPSKNLFLATASTVLIAFMIVAAGCGPKPPIDTETGGVTRVQGNVRDAKTGAGVARATVTLLDGSFQATNQIARTAEDGFYTLDLDSIPTSGVPKVEVWFEVRGPGHLDPPYNPKKESSTIVLFDLNEKDWNLVRDSIPPCSMSANEMDPDSIIHR